MITKNDLIYNAKRLLLLRYTRFGSDIAAAKFEYNNNLKYHTAATDGKTIYFDPNYFASLNDDEKIFLIAHEIMHNKFKHMLRIYDKEGNKRDIEIWNDATDAIINANLKRDGFKIKKGYIDRDEALNYNAEEFYEILLKEKQNNNQEEKNNRENGNGDDHSLWEEAYDKFKNEEEKEILKDSFTCNEKEELQKNREERKAIIQKKLDQSKEQLLKDIKQNEISKSINLGEVGQANNSIDWILLLRREIEKSETVWSRRRSIFENNYAYRLEEYDIEDESETEVLIDVSGSVKLDMVKLFLKLIKPILKNSKLKVGCFNEKFWGMLEIESEEDIDNFDIPSDARGSAAWTEDWDLAVRSFTKKREINKIIFTDGIPGPGNMPKKDLKNENIIWIVYGNKNFNPCCGKVINITKEQLYNNYNRRRR